VCGHGNADADHQAVWIGLQYEKHSDTKPGSAQAEVEFQSFLRQSELEFSRDNLHNYQYLEATERNASRKAFDKALHDGGMSDISRVTILTPRRGDFAARTGNVLEWAIGSYAIGAVLWMLMLLPVGLDPKKVKRLVRPGSASVLYDASPALALVIPSRQSFGLPLLVDLNVAVFVAMVLAGLGFVDFQADDLLSWGSNYRPAVHGFGTLRLVSSQFVHGGLMHLANNMYGLMFAGIFLTPVVKNGRLLVCYLLAGLSGSVASVWAHPATISVGASGAIFGLYGVLLVLLAFRDPRIEAGRQVVLINAGIFVGFNLLIGSVSRGIDNAAHIGGLAAGLMIGLVIYSLDRAHRSTHEPARQ
jgi:membrane associated rhomboid family serine protease